MTTLHVVAEPSTVRLSMLAKLLLCKGIDYINILICLNDGDIFKEFEEFDGLTARIQEVVWPHCNDYQYFYTNLSRHFPAQVTRQALMAFRIWSTRVMALVQSPSLYPCLLPSSTKSAVIEFV